MQIQSGRTVPLSYPGGERGEGEGEGGECHLGTCHVINYFKLQYIDRFTRVNRMPVLHHKL
jgi:hypothetical protein